MNLRNGADKHAPADDPLERLTDQFTETCKCFDCYSPQPPAHSTLGRTLQVHKPSRAILTTARQDVIATMLKITHETISYDILQESGSRPNAESRRRLMHRNWHLRALEEIKMRHNEYHDMLMSGRITVNSLSTPTLFFEGMLEDPRAAGMVNDLVGAAVGALKIDAAWETSKSLAEDHPLRREFEAARDVHRAKVTALNDILKAESINSPLDTRLAEPHRRVHEALHGLIAAAEKLKPENPRLFEAVGKFEQTARECYPEAFVEKQYAPPRVKREKPARHEVTTPSIAPQAPKPDYVAEYLQSVNTLFKDQDHYKSCFSGRKFTAGDVPPVPNLIATKFSGRTAGAFKTERQPDGSMAEGAPRLMLLKGGKAYLTYPQDAKLPDLAIGGIVARAQRESDHTLTLDQTAAFRNALHQYFYPDFVEHPNGTQAMLRMLNGAQLLQLHASGVAGRLASALHALSLRGPGEMGKLVTALQDLAAHEIEGDKDHVSRVEETRKVNAIRTLVDSTQPQAAAGRESNALA